MRSLIPTAYTCQEYTTARLVATCINPEDDSVFALSEESDTTHVKLRLFHQGLLLAAFTSECQAAPSYQGHNVVSSTFLAESNSVVICLTGGDIVQIFIEDTQIEVAGSFDDGIQAAGWSPDDELVVIVTGSDTLLLMTKDFQVLSETPASAALQSTDFGSDKFVNVGWGHQDTQFRGSIGKSAGRTTNETNEEDVLVKGQHDFTPKISWRGDSAYFSISSVDGSGPSTSAAPPKYKRNIRFFSRTADLLTTAEISSGLEHSLAWQPSGSIIASTMKSKSADGKVKRDVIFYERNGLRRYDFSLRESNQEEIEVKGLRWNSDSSILAVWSRVAGKLDTVQLWYRNNYHWYLKQEVTSESGSAFVSVCWHLEKPLDICIATETSTQWHRFEWEVIASSRAQPHDSGATAVIDGSSLLLTPFRYANVPPPMSAYRVDLSTSAASSDHATAICASFSSTDDLLAVLLQDRVLLLNTTSGNPISSYQPSILATLPLPSDQLAGLSPLQVCLLCSRSDQHISIAVLLSSGSEIDGDQILRLSINPSTMKIEDSQTVACPFAICRIFSQRSGFLAMSQVNGSVFSVDLDGTCDILDQSLPASCSRITYISPTIDRQNGIMIGLTSSGRLYAGQKLIDNQCTSFVQCGTFLIFSTATHTARFIHLDDLQEATITEYDVSKADARRLERGSKIVTAVASTMSLILQMPRGNLETICPRPLVLQLVLADLDEQNYKRAFINCRKHRIDLNIFYDHDPEQFRTHLSKFVDQVDEVDHLNLFISSLRNHDVTDALYKPRTQRPKNADDFSDKVNTTCASIRELLSAKDDLPTYVNSILTAYLCQQPPDYENALRLLATFRTSHPDIADDAIKYIIFLSDANRLYDVALSLYDFNLVLMIAQHSQKDPKEYIPFLRELRKLEPHYQRYRIDDHLQNYTGALRNLIAAGSRYQSEADDFTVLHGLYDDALMIYADDSARYKTIHGLYAQYLVKRSKYSEAGLHYTLAEDRTAAIDAYASSSDWRECFALCLSPLTPNDPPIGVEKITELALDISSRLKGTSAYGEAARVLLDYARDVEGSITASCEGSEFREAIRIATLYSRAELIESLILPAAEEAADRLVETIEDASSQITKQVDRLADLAVIRERDLDAYMGEADYSQAIEGVDVDDSASTAAGTAFTRYTAAAPTTGVSRTTQGSGRSKKSRRKDAMRKEAGGKKGTIWEEDYLLGSLSRMVEGRLASFQKEVGELLPVLLQLTKRSRDGIERGAELQSTLKKLEAQVKDKVKIVWEDVETRGKELDRPAAAGTVGQVKRPVVPNGRWSIGLLDQ